MSTVESTTTTADAQAFLRDFRSLSVIGETPGHGVDRQAATAADAQARAWFTSLAAQYGFRTEVDRTGNVFALLEWTPGAPSVLVGSHLDSQPTAGKYDGAYGVAAALHAGRRLAESTVPGEEPKYNLAVVDWFNEEGCRFAPSMMGSSVYTGKLPVEEALAVQDKQGTTVAQALEAIGHLGAGTGPTAAAYAEIHIEQGRSLEDTGTTIGLVHSCWAAAKYSVTVHGEQAHTGSAVIADRKDALLGASMLVVLLRETTHAFPGAVLHTSVGQLDVYPNSPVVVPSRVDLVMDLRSADEEVLAAAQKLLHEGITRIESDANVTIDVQQSHAWGLNPYQPAGVDLARECADKLELSHAPVFTLAGHDSINMKDIVPTVMLFVPSVDGISHNEREFTHDDDACAGVDMLTEVVARLCRGELDGAK
ncbi:M20 family metallo-hydrolase [Arthrobacter sp. FW306-2-2C-D06B]|uniref:M20 family metallo-hydrolase n=1 Tax=Arthrobacter sp. FW306-2-2C-D06B TaxID=2879618 RepID=UPI001F2127E3|nr:M20 family metallo-hydrolase [Arthrobacter sp. FW306-2-2C-D06B]UKA60584.1 M20 family metallo-hydrolase [Arthrobacter sp. FW306-2-2C-D06B]